MENIHTNIVISRRNFIGATNIKPTHLFLNRKTFNKVIEYLKKNYNFQNDAKLTKYMGMIVCISNDLSNFEVFVSCKISQISKNFTK